MSNKIISFNYYMRSHSNSRLGRTAFMEALEKVTPSTSAKSFNKTFKEIYAKHYPDSTETTRDNVLKYLLKNHDWGTGNTFNSSTNVIELVTHPSQKDAKKMLYEKFAKDQKVWLDKEFKDHLQKEEPAITKYYDDQYDIQGQELYRKGAQIEKIMERKKDLGNADRLDALEKIRKDADDKYKRDMLRGVLEQRKMTTTFKKNVDTDKKTIDDEMTAELEDILKEERKRREEARERQKAREEHDEEVKKYNTDTTNRKKEPPQITRPDIKPTVEVKEFEEDHTAENQLKKIDAGNIKKIDNKVKFNKIDNNTNVNATVKKSSILQALEKQRDRLKLGHARIKFTKLGAKTKQDTQNII